MDLMDLQTADAPVWFNIPHPSTGADLENNGKPVRMSLHSPDSKTLKALRREVQRRRLSQAGRTGRINLTPEELESEELESVTTAIAGWENLAIGGVLVEYSTAKAKELLSEPRLSWLFDWVGEKMRDRGNFIGAPARPLKK